MDGKGKGGLPSFGARQSTVFGLCFLVTLLAYVDRVGFSVAFTKLSTAAGQDQVCALPSSPDRSPERRARRALNTGTMDARHQSTIAHHAILGRWRRLSGVTYPLPRPSTQPSRGARTRNALH